MFGPHWAMGWIIEEIERKQGQIRRDVLAHDREQRNSGRRDRTSDQPLRSLPGAMLWSNEKYQKIRPSVDFFTSRKFISYHPVVADISMFFTVPFALPLAGF